jgi:hypothetical protein
VLPNAVVAVDGHWCSGAGGGVVVSPAWRL